MTCSYPRLLSELKPGTLLKGKNTDRYWLFIGTSPIIHTEPAYTEPKDSVNTRWINDHGEFYVRQYDNLSRNLDWDNWEIAFGPYE